VSAQAAAVPFELVQQREAHRTVIDHRLTWRQRDDVGAVLAQLAAELADVRREVHAHAVTTMAPHIVTVRDVERVALWLDSMGHAQSANDTRTALYAAALRLRQVTEV
jgi:hypothetical protein